MRNNTFKLSAGDAIVVYSEPGRIVLQVRRLVHGADDPLAASFKSGVLLAPAEAIKVATELLIAATRDAERLNETTPDV